MKNFKKIGILFLAFLMQFYGYSQKKESPYQMYGWSDAAWVVGGIGVNVYGLSLIQNKDKLSEEDYLNLDKEDIWGIDRWAAGNDDERASEISDIPFYLLFRNAIRFTIR